MLCVAFLWECCFHDLLLFCNGGFFCFVFFLFCVLTMWRRLPAACFVHQHTKIQRAAICYQTKCSQWLFASALCWAEWFPDVISNALHVRLQHQGSWLGCCFGGCVVTIRLGAIFCGFVWWCSVVHCVSQPSIFNNTLWNSVTSLMHGVMYSCRYSRALSSPVNITADAAEVWRWRMCACCFLAFE